MLTRLSCVFLEISLSGCKRPLCIPVHIVQFFNFENFLVNPYSVIFISPNWFDSYFSMISYPWFDLTFTKLLKLEFSGSAPDSNLYCFYSSIFSFALKRGVPCYMITILPHNAQAVKAKIQGAIPG